MDNITILWVDDEIDLLRSQIMFLEEKGYNIKAVTNGQDAIEETNSHSFDIVFLDESMPGLTGLETLAEIKKKQPNLPVVMITKNEEENLMDEALGSQIADYLIKPVKPNQILLSIKKIIDNKRLVSERTDSAYQQDFQNLFHAFGSGLDHQEWVDVYKKLVFWEMELSRSTNSDMLEVFNMQKTEANVEFNKFISKNYINWLQNPEEAPLLSHNLLKEKVFPNLSEGMSTFIILIDNLRYDQWKTIQPVIEESFRQSDDDTLYSILPTSTQYSRNAIFSGMMPLDMQHEFPNLWKNDADEGGKNMNEEEFLKNQINRISPGIKYSYTKITNNQSGRALEDNVLNLLHNELNVIVYNFVDMLSHARTEMEVLKELAGDEKAYRSITLSWFKHSPLLSALRKIADKKVRVIITSDHGTIRVRQPIKVIGDKNTTTNLRYKHGKNLNYNPKEVFEIKDPLQARLPSPNVSSSYIFAQETDFFVYPNNYNHYVNFFKNTFQHGGISLEEMIIPVVTYESK
ncbi:MAG: PglZ domain-containing protein [Bacteroidetes bacterium]|nr:PglZ domain-containing protein [Bacteroidota bacterium]